MTMYISANKLKTKLGRAQIWANLRLNTALTSDRRPYRENLRVKLWPSWRQTASLAESKCFGSREDVGPLLAVIASRYKAYHIHKWRNVVYWGRRMMSPEQAALLGSLYFFGIDELLSDPYSEDSWRRLTDCMPTHRQADLLSHIFYLQTQTSTQIPMKAIKGVLSAKTFETTPQIITAARRQLVLLTSILAQLDAMELPRDTEIEALIKNLTNIIQEAKKPIKLNF